MSPAEKYGELLRDHFKYFLQKVREEQFQRAVAEALEEAEEAEGTSGQQATLSVLKKLVKSKLTTIIEEIEEEERQAELERQEHMRRRERDSTQERDGSIRNNRRQRSTAKNMKNSVISTSPAPRKWKDTRRVTYNREGNTERSTYRGSTSIKKKKKKKKKIKSKPPGKLAMTRATDYLTSMANVMNKYAPAPKPKPKKKRKRRKKPYIPGESNQITYKQSAATTLGAQKNRHGSKSKGKNRRNSVANSRMSCESDGFSNSRMLRIFVKEAVKERHGTDELDAAIMNRSLSQSSMRIFNELRAKERDRNSPNKLLERVSGKARPAGQSIVGAHGHHGSRESTLSVRRKRSNLIYEIEDRSLSAKDRELNDILRQSNKKYTNQVLSYHHQN